MGTIPTLLVLPFVDVGPRIVFAIVALAFIAYAIGEAHGSGKPFWPRVWEHLKPWVILAVILTVIVVTALWADHQP